MEETHDLKKVILALKRKKVVAFPTETSYGLLGNALLLEIVEKIYKIKKREKKFPLSVLVKDEKMAKEYVVFNSRIKKLFSNFYTKKKGTKKEKTITMIGKSKKKIPVKYHETLAFRVSFYHRIKELFEAIDFPLTATSANISGEGDLYSHDEIVRKYKYQKNQPDLVFTGGKLLKRKPTTVVDLSGDEARIVREGEVNLDEINKVLNLESRDPRFSLIKNPCNTSKKTTNKFIT